ncbi:MAG: AbrB/MazE/SpoVT family DNA-binding domain-containing protein [Spirochaetes bacterium]|nr:AbrB/MazE/SpoVT family DNA-binding domain-containing protein [Spirochaetota bacterium]
MEVKVQKWGNSLGVRIPKSYAEDIDIDQGSLIDISKEKDRIVIKPIRKKEKLSDLLSKITKDNLHKEIDTGDSIGNEIW